MNNHRIRSSFVASGFLLAATLPAAGQSISSDWSALPAAGRQVYVTTDTGAEASGRLVRVDPDSLTILEKSQERRFARTDIVSVDRRGDSLRNGAIIGAITGAALGALEGVMSDCGSLLEPPRGCTAGETAGFVAIMTGVSTAVGVGIDALVRGRTEMYRRGASARSRATTVAPVMGRHALGIALAVSW